MQFVQSHDLIAALQICCHYFVQSHDYHMPSCRNPDHKQRPSFDKIVTYLKQPEDTLLYWSETDLAAAGTRSNVLGAPSTESRKLYVDLQKTYKIA